jgi:hypothetical protein
MFGLEQKDLLIYGGAALGGLVVLALLLRMMGGGKKPVKDLEKTQRENLDNYPSAPPGKASRRLTMDGLDVRLRLVVVAPAGTEHTVTADQVPELLDDLLRGLAGFLNADKPRVRVWPPQLSVAGFAPSFFRLVESPDDEGVKSHWIRLAGPIRIGGTPYLLGLALFADELSKLGTITLEPRDWVKHLQIEK